MSLRERFALRTKAQREAWLAEQEPELLEEIIRGAWWWEARPAQVPPPGDWFLFLILAGRGFGKSRAGAEWIAERPLLYPLSVAGIPTEHLVVAETLADAKNICMEGDSGVLNALTRRGLVRDVDYRYKQSPKPTIIFSSGAKIMCEGADDEDAGRGYNLVSIWCDEICKWPTAVATYDEGLVPALRVDIPGDHPRVFATSTPKKGSHLLRRWLQEVQSPDPKKSGAIRVIRGSTFDNASNLNSHSLQALENRYAGTSIGRQELYGEILEDEDGALFARTDLDAARVDHMPLDADIVSIVVGVDPAQVDDQGNLSNPRRTSAESHDEMGVIVVARTRDDDLWVLADESIQAAGRSAAVHVWLTALRYNASRVVCEDVGAKRWMRDVFHDAYRELQTQGIMPADTEPFFEGVDAKLGKRTRAEPVAMRSQQKRLHMVGAFERLEDQLTQFSQWDGKESPDRLDALVHACRFHMLSEKNKVRVLDPRTYDRNSLDRFDQGLGPGFDYTRW